jgi:2'-hydroxyisoflavone reductase
MTGTRREFIASSLLAGLTARVMGYGAVPKPAESLRILILGGTGFIGPHQVEYALRRGHQLTLFNRGRTNPELFPQVEQLRGDRNNDLESLEGRRWDAVVDNSASLPRWVRQSAELLRDAAGQYLFVSSLSVYSDNSIIGIDEAGPVGTLEDPTTEEITGHTFGPLKALCEREAEKAFPGRALVVRPGLIVGPGDRSDRFTYWPVRIDRGGDVLAPGAPSDPVQLIDARDLARWMIHLLERRHSGVFNATGPKSPLSMAEMLYGIRAVTSAEVSFTWVEADFLQEFDVRPWSHMPVWIPPRDGMEGFSRVDCGKAFSHGLTFRPLADTARDTLEWFKSLPAERRGSPRAGLPREREAEVLEAWNVRKTV